MTIRKARPEDCRRISVIESSVFNSPWTENQIRWELKDQSLAVNLVVENKDLVVGYLMAHVLEGEAHIVNMAVALPYQHRGYGNALLKRFLDGLEGDCKVSLEVRPSNLPALKLYTESGFEEVGVRESYYGDGENALVLVKGSGIHALV